MDCDDISNVIVVVVVVKIAAEKNQLNLNLTKICAAVNDLENSML